MNPSPILCCLTGDCKYGDYGPFNGKEIPMGSMDYFRSATRDLHKSCFETIEGLSDDQLHFRPLNAGNHIAFILWHCVRTEDNVLNLLLQKKKTVWNAEGWDEKLGMDPRTQGTGMSAEEAAGVRIRDIGEFKKYMESAFKSTEAFLETVKEEDLEQVHDLPFLGKRNLYQLIGGIILHHGANHLGEISYVKGLQGMKGSAH